MLRVDPSVALVPADQEPEDSTSLEELLFPALPEIAKDSKLGKAIAERLTKQRLRATAILTLQSQGFSRREIGRMCGMSPNAVRMALNRARKLGKLNDLRSILENDSMSLAIEGLNHHLRLKDKDAIFEHLKGMGQWRSYNNNKHDGVPPGGLPELNVVVNVVAGAPRPDVAAIGVPREDSDA